MEKEAQKHYTGKKKYTILLYKNKQKGKQKEKGGEMGKCVCVCSACNRLFSFSSLFPSFFPFFISNYHFPF